MFGINEKNKKLSTESYKGVRDFYPEDLALQNYIFDVWEKVAESWGYSEYSASILEPAELYKSKTSDEIVNNQTYTFNDRGNREVTLRPEMTPTVARMIAGKLNEIPMPARWYSIPNIFRYEKPQKGRLREHWQLNVDLFGSDSPYADAEIISVASDIMKKFGAKPEDFEIAVNSRALMNAFYKELGIPEEKSKIITRIIDKKDKIPEDVFREAMEKELGETGAKFLSILDAKDGIFEMLNATPEVKRLSEVITILERIGVANMRFSSSLTRGFDYYTGIVFEIFDTNKENPRSLLGGGRYDNLLNAFSNKKVPALGFGMGDVTIRDFLEIHKLTPQLSSTTQVWIAVVPETDLDEVYKLAEELRQKEVKVGIDIGGRKLGDQIAGAEKRGIPIILPIGRNELQSGNFIIRRLADRVEKSVARDHLADEIKKIL